MEWTTRIVPYPEHGTLWLQAEQAYRRNPNFLSGPPRPLNVVEMRTDVSIIAPGLLPGSKSRRKIWKRTQRIS
jgi:hypothetical protein